MSQLGSRDLDERLKNLAKGEAHVGQFFTLQEAKDGRTTVAQYMGGQRWRIIVKRPVRG